MKPAKHGGGGGGGAPFEPNTNRITAVPKSPYLMTVITSRKDIESFNGDLLQRVRDELVKEITQYGIDDYELYEYECPFSRDVTMIIGDRDYVMSKAMSGSYGHIESQPDQRSLGSIVGAVMIAVMIGYIIYCAIDNLQEI
jgi:hypothetical protein